MLFKHFCQEAINSLWKICRPRLLGLLSQVPYFHKRVARLIHLTGKRKKASSRRRRPNWDQRASELEAETDGKAEFLRVLEGILFFRLTELVAEDVMDAFDRRLSEGVEA